jgi:hypothetical protein
LKIDEVLVGNGKEHGVDVKTVDPNKEANDKAGSQDATKNIE